MFAKLLHGLTATISRIKQLWTNENIPDDIQLLHDFNDGNGLVSASPVDESSLRNDLVKLTKFEIQVDGSALRNDLVKLTKFDVRMDGSSFRNDLVSFSRRVVPSDSSSFRNDIVDFQRS